MRKKLFIITFYRWLMLMVFFMEIIVQIYRVMISTEFGNNREKIFILKYMRLRSIFTLQIE